MRRESIQLLVPGAGRLVQSAKECLGLDVPSCATTAWFAVDIWPGFSLYFGLIQEEGKVVISRWQQKEVLESLRDRRVVHVTGARQSGKTTLVKMLGVDACARYTMDDAALRQVAQSDPYGLTRRSANGPVVVDEVQKAPELLDAIKMHVDEDADNGQYLLTGSSSLDFTRKIPDSLAGRLRFVRLRTLALGEILGH